MGRSNKRRAVYLAGKAGLGASKHCLLKGWKSRVWPAWRYFIQAGGKNRHNMERRQKKYLEVNLEITSLFPREEVTRIPSSFAPRFSRFSFFRFF